MTNHKLCLFCMILMTAQNPSWNGIWLNYTEVSIWMLLNCNKPQWGWKTLPVENKWEHILWSIVHSSMLFNKSSLVIGPSWLRSISHLFGQSVIFPKHHPKKSTSAIYLKAADVATVKCVKSFHGMKICCPLKNLIKFFKSNSR